MPDCPLAYVKNRMSKLHQIFCINFAVARSSDNNAIRYVNDVMLSHNRANVMYGTANGRRMLVSGKQRRQGQSFINAAFHFPYFAPKLPIWGVSTRIQDNSETIKTCMLSKLPNRFQASLHTDKKTTKLPSPVVQTWPPSWKNWKKSPYLRNSLTDRHKIWHRDTLRPSWPFRPLKFPHFKNPSAVMLAAHNGVWLWRGAMRCVYGGEVCYPRLPSFGNSGNVITCARVSVYPLHDSYNILAANGQHFWSVNFSSYLLNM